VLQVGQVTRNRRLGQLKNRHEITDAELSLQKQTEDAKSSFVGKCFEHTSCSFHTDNISAYAVAFKDYLSKPLPDWICERLLFPPDNLLPGNDYATGIAEEDHSAFFTEFELLITLRAVRIHIVFVIEIIAIAFVTGKFGSIRSKFLQHFRAAITANSSFHDTFSSDPMQ
jgi:hypothetical protein